MKNKKVIIVIVLVVVILGGYFGERAYMGLKTYQKRVDEITISNVNISKVADGTYFGSCDVSLVSADVKVTVNNHQITGIELVKHNNGKGAPAEIIPSKVVEAQTLDVDIVSGATSSSKVILKAIENALNSSPT